MPNWKNIKKLRKHLTEMKITKYRKFNMGDYIAILGNFDGNAATVGQIRANGPACGTAGCLAGEAVIALAPANTLLEVDSGIRTQLSFGGGTIEIMAAMLLNLNNEEVTHMFAGEWTRTEITKIRRRQAITYLDKVIAAKNVMVFLSK